MQFPWRRRAQRESELDEEMETHFAMEVAQRMEAGATREEAEQAARKAFGNVTRVKEVTRSMWGTLMWEQITKETRFTMRRLRRAPAFTITAMVTLGLCLGANLTIFAVMDAILLRPLPFPEAKQLVTIYNTYPKAGVERDGASIANYYERREKIPAFSSVSIYGAFQAIVGADGSTRRLPVVGVSPEFFVTVGKGPLLGRVFSDSDMNPGEDASVILANDFWREHFAGDPQAIGKTVFLNGNPKKVAGVLPADFRFLSTKAALYVPLSSSRDSRESKQQHSGGNVIQMIARLKTGATLEQAQAQIDAQNQALERYDPQARMMADAGFRSVVAALHGDQVAAIRPVLILLQTGVLALLAIGVVNLINLLLIRASGRMKEMAVRQALGAGGLQIANGIFVETLTLGLGGGLLAMAIGFGGVRLVALLGAERLPFGEAIHFDARVAAAALGASVALSFALALPIVWFSLRSSAAGLQAESRTMTGGRAAQALRHVFVMAQVALGFVLLAATGWLGMSLQKALAVSPGFQPENVVAGQISLVGARYPSPQVGLAFTDRLAEQLREQPGVVAAGIATNIPFSGRNGKSAATAESAVARPGESPRGIYSYGVAGDYFQAMGFVLKAGRFLTSDDSKRAGRVCVVDEDYARFNWPGRSALGERLFMGGDRGPSAEAFTVVGVVGRIRQAGLTDDTAQGAVYYPFVYRPDSSLYVVVRAQVTTQALAADLRRVVKGMDPELSLNDEASMNERISASLEDRRSPALLGGIFSGIALLLIAVGTYGVLSYAVAMRRREIAVRMAVGARPAQIRTQFMAIAMRLVVVGVGVGAAGAWVAERAMASLLFHMAAGTSATVLLGAVLVVGALGLVACVIPAERAARVQAMEALAE